MKLAFGDTVQLSNKRQQPASRHQANRLGFAPDARLTQQDRVSR